MQPPVSHVQILPRSFTQDRMLEVYVGFVAPYVSEYIAGYKTFEFALGTLLKLYFRRTDGISEVTRFLLAHKIRLDFPLFYPYVSIS